jgi:DNA modification methylase
LIAADKMNRHARLCELDPRFADVIVRRWEILTGEAATLDGDGRSFDAVAAERAP